MTVHTTSRVSTVADVIPLSPSPPSSSSSTRPSQTHLRIPPGLCIILPLEALGRNREWWGDDADEFRPERWGEDAEGDEGKDGKVKGRGMKMNRRMGGMAFLMGPRGCKFVLNSVPFWPHAERD